MSNVRYIYEVVWWEHEQACELPWGIPSVPQMAYSGSLDSGCVTEDTSGEIPMGGIGTEVKVFRIVWLPVNQAWLVMFGDSRLAGPYNDRAEAEAYLQDIGADYA